MTFFDLNQTEKWCLEKTYKFGSVLEITQFAKILKL